LNDEELKIRLILLLSCTANQKRMYKKPLA
jgi:hypothetical protein